MPVLFRVLIAASLFASSVAYAADPPFYSHKTKGAIRGADPVAYFSLEPGASAVQGVDQFTHEWMDATWRFATAENRGFSQLYEDGTAVHWID